MRFPFDTVRSNSGLVIISQDTAKKYGAGRFKIYFASGLVKKAYIIPEAISKGRPLSEFCEKKIFELKRRAIR